MTNTATLNKEALQNAYLTTAWRKMCCVGRPLLANRCWFTL